MSALNHGGHGEHGEERQGGINRGGRGGRGGNPIVEAQKITMESGATTEQWVAALRAHLLNGFVVSTPRCFAMGRPIRHDADPEAIFDLRHTFSKPDCWFIHTAAGELGELVQQFPFWLPLICFQRADGEGRRGAGQRMRFYQSSRLHSLGLGFLRRAQLSTSIQRSIFSDTQLS